MAESTGPRRAQVHVRAARAARAEHIAAARIAALRTAPDASFAHEFRGAFVVRFAGRRRVHAAAPFHGLAPGDE